MGLGDFWGGGSGFGSWRQDSGRFGVWGLSLGVFGTWASGVLGVGVAVGFTRLKVSGA